MAFIGLIVLVILIGVYSKKSNRKGAAAGGFLGALVALVAFPLGVIFALTKKYK